MSSLTRTLRFVAFTLVEYARSGRILIELLASVIFFYIFLRRWTSAPPPEYFFSTTGLFVLGLTFYTASSVQSLGDRPQGYLLLVRRIGRGGYLLGLYLAVQLIVWSIYGLLCLATALYNPVRDLDLRGWLLGSIPLLLNATLLGALLLLLAPMVLPGTGRLAVLALIAVAFSGSLLSGQTLAGLPAALTAALSVLRTIFSTPLLPAFTGFALSVSREYGGIAFAIPLAQLSLTLGLLSLAIYIFSRREIIFSGA
ncbi:MAG: hypothetical protein IPO81_12215 [Kouleothrix sp.]|nr:hypothetical protein [Kouleothrix sp.]